MKRVREQKMKVTEMRMLRLMRGHMRMDKIRNKILERNFELYLLRETPKDVFNIVWICT